jgi:hypothetical protein
MALLASQTGKCIIRERAESIGGHLAAVAGRVPVDHRGAGA